MTAGYSFAWPLALIAILFLPCPGEGQVGGTSSADTIPLFRLPAVEVIGRNDTHGHDLGDRLLSEAGSRITACVRATDTAGRMGGDEFTVVMCDLTETGRVRQVAEEIVGLLKEPFLLEGRQVHVSTSIGIALSPRDGTKAIDLLRCADRAMYAAKQEGGCGYRYFR